MKDEGESQIPLEREALPAPHEEATVRRDRNTSLSDIYIYIINICTYNSI